MNVFLPPLSPAPILSIEGAPDSAKPNLRFLPPSPAVNINDANEETKSRLTALITLGGGTVFNSWDSLYRVDFKLKESRRRREGNMESVRWAGPRHVEEVLCIAAQATQTAKYMMALELGVPCISINWVEECAKQVCSCHQATILSWKC